MFKKINFYQLSITIIAVLFASAIMVYGWTAPVGAPPGNDVPPPINVSSTLQVKDGPLFVSNIPNSLNFGLSVLSGNLIVGSTTVTVQKGNVFNGYINSKDVWLRDANGGAGAWASQSGGGTLNQNSCYWSPEVQLNGDIFCNSGYYVAGTRTRDCGNWSECTRLYCCLSGN